MRDKLKSTILLRFITSLSGLKISERYQNSKVSSESLCLSDEYLNCSYE